MLPARAPAQAIPPPVLLLLLLLAACGASWGGRSVDEWIEVLGTPSIDGSKDLDRLVAAGPDSLPVVRQILDRGDPERRATLLSALLHGPLPPSDLLPLFRPELDSPSTPCRLVATVALGELFPPTEAVPALQRRLADADPAVRWTAANALGGIGPAAADAVPDLLSTVEGPDPRLGGRALVALARIAPDSPAVRDEVLVAILRADRSTATIDAFDLYWLPNGLPLGFSPILSPGGVSIVEIPSVPLATVEAARRIGPPLAPRLREIIAGDKPRAALLACLAVAPDETGEATARLRELSRAADPDVGFAAACSLVALGVFPEDAVAAVVRSLEQTAPGSTPAWATIEMLKKLGPSGGEAARRALFPFLGEPGKDGPDAVREALKANLGPPETEIAGLIAAAGKKPAAGMERALGLLLLAADDPAGRQRIRPFFPELVHALIPRLDDSDPAVRRIAAETLGRLGRAAADAGMALGLRAGTERDAEVRGAILQALEQMRRE